MLHSNEWIGDVRFVILMVLDIFNHSDTLGDVMANKSFINISFVTQI